MTHHAPGTEADCAAIVTEAVASRTPLEIVGGGTRRGLGRPVQTAATLSTGGLSGVTLYEPSEMVIAARAGTPLRLVEATLAERGQALPFEPMDHRPLLESEGEPTIGAIAAANVSGPRRIQAGAARDSLIGVRFVNGRGEAIVSGGRVMKNVTGLDLVKLQAGAFGTLGLLTEVIFKVLPLPETTVTLVLHGLDETRAVAALSDALGSPYDMTGAAHLPSEIERVPKTLIRIEGFSPSVAHRIAELRKLLKPYGALDVVEAEPGAPLWRRVRDAEYLAESREAAVWRISVAPSRGPVMVARLRSSLPAVRAFYDWGGGLVWLSVPGSQDGGMADIRAALVSVAPQGHATLVRASPELRARIDVFQPLSEPLMRVTRGVKAALDPEGIINPGRMYAGV